MDVYVMDYLKVFFVRLASKKEGTIKITLSNVLLLSIFLLLCNRVSLVEFSPGGVFAI